MTKNAINIKEVWNPVCFHGNKTVKLKLGSKLSRILLQRINLFFIIFFDQNLVEYMTLSLGHLHILKWYYDQIFAP